MGYIGNRNTHDFTGIWGIQVIGIHTGYIGNRYSHDGHPVYGVYR